MSEDNLKSMSDLVGLCKRRGFIFQSSEIYGGQGGFWDYGPLGVELKMNVKNRWWRAMTLAPSSSAVLPPSSSAIMGDQLPGLLSSTFAAFDFHLVLDRLGFALPGM